MPRPLPLYGPAGGSDGRFGCGAAAALLAPATVGGSGATQLLRVGVNTPTRLFSKRQRIEPVAAQPALHLGARLAHRARSRGHVPGVCAQVRHQFIPSPLLFCRQQGRRFPLRCRAQLRRQVFEISGSWGFG